MVEQKVDDCSQDAVLAFTDDSCRRNPGPCGAGAGVFFPGQEGHALINRS